MISIYFAEYFSKDHEWVVIDAGVGSVGITKYAKEKLGDIVYVQLPEVNTEIKKNGKILQFFILLIKFAYKSTFSLLLAKSNIRFICLL